MQQWLSHGGNRLDRHVLAIGHLMHTKPRRFALGTLGLKRAVFRRMPNSGIGLFQDSPWPSPFHFAPR